MDDMTTPTKEAPASRWNPPTKTGDTQDNRRLGSTACQEGAYAPGAPRGDEMGPNRPKRKVDPNRESAKETTPVRNGRRGFQGSGCSGTGWQRRLG